MAKTKFVASAESVLDTIGKLVKQTTVQTPTDTTFQVPAPNPTPAPAYSTVLTAAGVVVGVGLVLWAAVHFTGSRE